MTRVSKSCNYAIIWLRKIFQNLLEFWTIERETGKNWHWLHVFVIIQQLLFLSPVSHVLYRFVIACFCVKLSIRTFDCAKQFTFKKSPCDQGSLWNYSQTFYLSTFWHRATGHSAFKTFSHPDSLSPRRFHTLAHFWLSHSVLYHKHHFSGLKISSAITLGAHRLCFGRKSAIKPVANCLGDGMSRWQDVLWQSVWVAKCLGGQMSWWQNVL